MHDSPAISTKTKSVVSKKEQKGAGSFFKPVIQPKLIINQPNDIYEQEADAVAEKVMRMPDSKTEPLFFQPKPVAVTPVQRKCTACEEEDKIQRKEDEDEELQLKPENNLTAQRKCADCEEEDEDEVVQRKSLYGRSVQRKPEECEQEEEKPFPPQTLKVSSPAVQKKGSLMTPVVSPTLATSIESAKGRGNHMDRATLSFMMPRFRTDFSKVKIHNDADAAVMSKQIGAKAFTVGNDIFFNDGEFQPHSINGKKLLAHELTHVMQQTNPAPLKVYLFRKPEDGAPTPAGSVCDQYTSVPAIGQEGSGQSEESSTATTVESLPESAPTEPKPVSPSPQTEATIKKIDSSPPAIPVTKSATQKVPDDPAFKELLSESKTHSKKQKKHSEPIAKTIHATDAVKNENEAEANSAINSGATVLLVNDVVNTGPGSQEQQKKFDAEKFKNDIKQKIAGAFLNTETDALPKNHGEAKKIVNDRGKLNNVTDTTKNQMREAKDEVVGGAQKINDSNLVTEDYRKKIPTAPGESFEPEQAGAKPVITDPERAIPKPLDEEEMQMDKDHDADSLDRVMAEHKVSDNQLAESEEPKFLDTLAEKQTSQRELCKIPQQLRQAENAQLQGDALSAQKMIKGGMGGMNNVRKDQFGQVQGKQENVKSEGELRLQEYYTDIKNIYETTELNVNNSLAYLECSVTTLFQNAVDSAFEVFKTNVTDRLDYYYDWHIIRRDYEKEDKMTKMLVNDRIDNQIKWFTVSRDMFPENDPNWKKYNDKIVALRSGRAKLIIEKIFDEEKKTFTDALDNTIDDIAIKVVEGLNHAKDLIAKGREAMDKEYKSLSEENQKKAAEATTDFTERFKDLESKVDDKETDLKDGLVKQYTESVAKLKDTFETIRKEAAMSWWEKAWRKIKEIVTVIIDIGKLLLKILVKAAGVIGDIIAHPIRFFGNLIDAVSSGFSNFVKRLPEHLENIIFKLILGVVPAGLTLPEKWDAKGIFSFVLDFFGLSKQNIRAQAVAKFGEPVVSQLEQGFELFIIFKNEGFAGLWEHIKEKIGDLKNAIIEEVKTFFKEAIIKAAIEFLLSALTPASGFIKVCKAIIGIVTFFIKNLVNILKLLDSILDSFADMAAGKIQKAANRVESALADILLVGIKFLAALVGINLDKIQSRIAKIINAVRNPINRAIQWLFNKAQLFAEKTGLLGVIRKGREKFEAGKAWVKDKADKGKDLIKQQTQKAVGKIFSLFDWKKTKKAFKTKDGQSHSIYLENKDGTPTVIMASFPTLLSALLREMRSKEPYKNDSNKLALIDRAEEIMQIVNAQGMKIKKLDEKLNMAKEESEKETLLNAREDLLDELIVFETLMTTNLHELLEGESYSDLENIYAVEGLIGAHAQAPKKKYIFDADHQPSNKMLTEAANLPGAPKMLKQIAASRSSWATTITLHKNRHKKGRTYGSSVKQPAREFVANLKAALAGQTDESERLFILEDLLMKETEKDAEHMVNLVKNSPVTEPLWNDINTEPDADKLRLKIISQIVHGENIIINQKISIHTEI